MASARIENALRGFDSLAIKLDLNDLGHQINELIEDVGKLQVVMKGDLTVCMNAGGDAPKTIIEAMENGTKFFDAVYYFAAEGAAKPTLVAMVQVTKTSEQLIAEAKKRLLWTAIFLMLRGSYPEAVGREIGRDIPAFLINICGMNESPADVSAGLASFDVKKIDPVWIRGITWSTFSPAIRQRLALGLAGYRMLGPFKLYTCRDDASDEVKAAFDWVRAVASQPADYAILSCTRSAGLISKLGSWNKALGNLMLLSFTGDQLTEMTAQKIIFARPVNDPRSNTWRSWAANGPLPLENPILLG